MPLSQLGPVRGENHRQVGKARGGPAQGLVEADVARRAGQPVVAAHHMTDTHVVVVDNVGQVVGGKAVGAQHHEVVDQPVFERDLAVDHVLERGGALPWHSEAHDCQRAAAFQSGPFAGVQVPAAPVVARRAVFLPAAAPKLGKPFCGAVAAVCVSVRYQGVGGFVVKLQSLRLIVWPERPANVGAFVPVQPQPGERLEQHLDRAFHVAVLVGILDANDEVAVIAPGEKPGEDRGSNVAYMCRPGGAWGVAHANSIGHGVYSSGPF